MANAGSFKKGEKRPGQGRPKGLANKQTTAIKDMIIAALDSAGGVTYLRQQAKDNPNAFLGLVGKVLPLQVAGDPDNPVGIRIETVIIDPTDPAQ